MANEELSDAEFKPLHPSTKQRVRAVRFGLSMDWWAVIVAVVLAVVVRFGAKIPW